MCNKGQKLNVRAALLNQELLSEDPLQAITWPDADDGSPRMYRGNPPEVAITGLRSSRPAMICTNSREVDHA